MIAVVQRVRSASVAVADEVIGRIGVGLCVMAAIEAGDGDTDLRWVAGKLVTLRIFPEGEKAFHRDVGQAGGGLLLVSNFTIAAATAAGRRPGFGAAMPPDAARPLFERFVTLVGESGLPVASGRFGADMIVSIENDGPVTLLIRSPTRAGRDA